MFRRFYEWTSQAGLLLVFSVTFGLFGALLDSALWGVYGGVLGLCVAIFIARASESWILWIHGATTEGVSASWIRYLEQAGGRKAIPRVLVYPHPFPQVWLARGLFCTQGTVLLSQGLISSLNEDELRVILRQAQRKLSRIQIPLLSYDFILLSVLLRWIPMGWVDLLFSQRRITPQENRTLSPWSLAVFSIIFPPLRALVQFVVDHNSRHFQGEAENEFQLVIRKVQNSLGPWQKSLDLYSRLGCLGEVSGEIASIST